MNGRKGNPGLLIPDKEGAADVTIASATQAAIAAAGHLHMLGYYVSRGKEQLVIDATLLQACEQLENALGFITAWQQR